tara:strand:- start:176 stop:1078 length:903 start_codon:yes stop_codon:yes gene_type:complete
MQLFKKTLTINFMTISKRTSWLSLCLFICSFLFLIIYNLNLTIEFTGGTKFNFLVPNANIVEFRENAQNILNQNIEVVEITNDNLAKNFLVSTKFISDETDFINKLKNLYPDISLKSIDSFGPKLGLELQQNARNAILLALLLISIYISIRFDRYYALGSLAALVHDVIITLGILSLLNIEIGITVIAALLTIVGYSLNDTIVVYDRIRENFYKLMNDSNINIINRSLNETLNRTVITSITTLLVVIILFFFGGAVLKPFAITLIIGILIGTYSSIFIASPVMLYFEEKYPIPEFKEEEV